MDEIALRRVLLEPATLNAVRQCTDTDKDGFLIYATKNGGVYVGEPARAYREGIADVQRRGKSKVKLNDYRQFFDRAIRDVDETGLLSFFSFLEGYGISRPTGGDGTAIIARVLYGSSDEDRAQTVKQIREHFGEKDGTPVSFRESPDLFDYSMLNNLGGSVFPRHALIRINVRDPSWAPFVMIQQNAPGQISLDVFSKLVEYRTIRNLFPELPKKSRKNPISRILDVSDIIYSETRGYLDVDRGNLKFDSDLENI